MSCWAQEDSSRPELISLLPPGVDCLDEGLLSTTHTLTLSDTGAALMPSSHAASGKACYIADALQRTAEPALGVADSWAAYASSDSGHDLPALGPATQQDAVYIPVLQSLLSRVLADCSNGMPTVEHITESLLDNWQLPETLDAGQVASILQEHSRLDAWWGCRFNVLEELHSRGAHLLGAFTAGADTPASPAYRLQVRAQGLANAMQCLAKVYQCEPALPGTEKHGFSMLEVPAEQDAKRTGGQIDDAKVSKASRSGLQHSRSVDSHNSGKAALREWLFDHFGSPYPNEMDRAMLAAATGLQKVQVNNWFINARVRIWRPLISEIARELLGNEDDSAELLQSVETVKEEVSSGATVPGRWLQPAPSQQQDGADPYPTSLDASIRKKRRQSLPAAAQGSTLESRLSPAHIRVGCHAYNLHQVIPLN